MKYYFPGGRSFSLQVFQRVISRTGGPGLTVDELLEGFTSPLLLLWGELDPWIRPAAADKIQARTENAHEAIFPPFFQNIFVFFVVLFLCA